MYCRLLFRSVFIIISLAGSSTAFVDVTVKPIALGVRVLDPYLLLAINPASHMIADAIINIRTNVLTCSFHLNERITASPMTAMIIGRSIKKIDCIIIEYPVCHICKSSDKHK